eukprot:s3099_g4.t1
MVAELGRSNPSRRSRRVAPVERATEAGEIFLGGSTRLAEQTPRCWIPRLVHCYRLLVVLGWIATVLFCATGAIFVFDMATADGSPTGQGSEAQQIGALLQQILQEQQAQRDRIDTLGQAVQGTGVAIQGTQQTTEQVIQQVVTQVQAGFQQEQQQNQTQIQQMAQAMQQIQGQVGQIPAAAVEQLTQIGQAVQNLQGQMQQQVTPAQVQQLAQGMQLLQDQVQQMGQAGNVTGAQSPMGGHGPGPPGGGAGGGQLPGSPQASPPPPPFQFGQQSQSSGQAAFGTMGGPTAMSPAVAYAIQQGGVDSRQIGKPGTFDPTSSKMSFQDWSDSIITLCDSSMPGIYECLEWITTTQPKTALDLNFMKGRFHHIDPLLLAYAESNIFAILSSYTGGEAKSLVRQAKRPNGMEAFRLLQIRFNPSTIGRQRAHLMKITNPQENVPLDKLAAEVVAWENRIVDYESRPQAERVSDAMRMAAVIHMCPNKLREHLQLNAGRFTSYVDLREEIFSYLDQVAPSAQSAMDIGALGKSSGCYNCGGPHMVKDCPKKGDKGKGKGPKGKGGGKDGSKGKNNKGSPKGGGKDGKGKKGGKKGAGPITCSNCGKTGHTYDQCWSKPKALNAVDPRLAELQSAYAKAALEDFKRIAAAPVVAQPSAASSVAGASTAAASSLRIAPASSQPTSPQSPSTVAHVGSVVVKSLCALARRAQQLSTYIFENTRPSALVNRLRMPLGTGEILVTLDSGAAASVCPGETFPNCQRLPAEVGLNFQAADGTLVPELYKIQPLVQTEEGTVCQTQFSVAGVNKILMSAAEVANRGHRIVLNPHYMESYIEDIATEERMAIYQHDGRILAVSPVEQQLEGVLPDGVQSVRDERQEDEFSYGPSTPRANEAEQGIFDVGSEPVEGAAAEELHAEFEEGTMRMAQRTPFKPSADEIREHNISHVPYRDWCVHCVRGRGRTLAHRRVPKSEEEKGRKRPLVHMDYFYLGARSEETLPILAMLDETTQRMFSITMPCKGLDHQYCAAIVRRLFKCLGLQDAIVKSDTERSIVALRSAIQEEFPGVGCEDAVKGESATNGPIESCVGRLQGQARTLKSSLEEHYNMKIPPRHPVLSWLVDYCGALISRFLRGPDGRTGYERSTGRPWRIKLPEFGENVLYQPLKGEREKKKIEPKFEPGIFLGLQEATGLRWIGTGDGVVRSWTIKRLADEDKWQRDKLESMIGLPWQLRPKIEKDADIGKLPLPFELAVEDDQPEEKTEEPPKEVKRRDYVPRGIYIRKDVELKQFGFTEGCDGCDRARHGLSHRAHSRACKERIMGELEKTEDGKQRVAAVRQKEEEYLVAVQEREEKKKRLSDEQLGGPLKSVKQIEGEREMDAILGPLEEVAAEEPGRDGPSGEQPSSSADVPAAEVPEIAIDGDAMEEEQNLVQQPAMDIGSLHRTSTDLNFVEAVREASLMETAQLLLDEEIELRRVLLQTGSLSLKRAYDHGGPSVVELFSPPRVTEFARSSLSNGVALDLTTCDEQGRAWDFNQPEVCERAEKLIDFLDPDLLIGCPPCAPFSPLQALNESKRDPEVVASEVAEGEGHLSFCCKQYRRRMSSGKYFVHEHPHRARSWGSADVESLAAEPEVIKVEGDMCAQGMMLQDEEGSWGFAKKRTGYLTNSPCIAEELSAQCTNEPDAVQIWRETCFEPKRGQLPGRKGPSWRSVVRRVTLDLTNGGVLQDLRDPQHAQQHDVRFKIPEGCIRVETLFYHVVEGKKWHRHIPLIGGKAKQCEVYPKGLIKSILRGLRRQLKRDVPVSSLDFGPTNQEIDVDLTMVSEDWSVFTDEVSGKPLEANRVREARMEEIDYANRYGVWVPVPIEEAWKETGKAPISSRWIDINKGDEERPQYRSRLVIQEVRHSNIEAIFAATPPLESVRMLLSLQRTGNERDRKGRRKKVMFIDIRRAHWTAKIFRKVFVLLPEEAGLPAGQCGRLERAMYGCRDAAACWELEITDFFTCNGFTPGMGSPVLFVNLTRDLKVSIHGDDITVLGFEDDLLWLKCQLEGRYELKFGGLLGPDKTDVQDVALLNRLIHYGESCTTIEADPRHVKIVLDELNLHGAKVVSTPGVQTKDADETPLDAKDSQRYRSLVMRCNYLALDRPDICFSSKELARKMQAPTKGSWNGLKRLARYLGGQPRLLWKYEDQPEQNKLHIHTDSDDAGCNETRKSTSCGALYHGKHLLKFYSSTQHVIALSSGESEFYAGVKAGSTLLGGLATMMDLGCEFAGELIFDATAAKAMMQRRGHGRAKHIARCYLWLQQRVQDGEISLGKALQQVQDKQTAWKSIEELQQVLMVVQKQMSTFAAELNDAKSGAEQVQQALQQVKEKSTFSEADTGKFGSSPETSKQVFIDVQKQMNSFDAELRDARKGAEEMSQALTEALTEVQKQMSSLDAEVKEARKDTEGMQQAFQELNEKTIGTETDSKIAAKSTESLQQALTEVQKQMSSLHAEIKDTKRGSEDMRQALQEMNDKITSTDADAKSVQYRFVSAVICLAEAFQELNEKTLGTETDSKIAAKSTESLQQALTEVQKQMSSLHAEFRDTKRGSEYMQQDLQAVREMTSCTDADAKTMAKRTEKVDQVLTEVQKQINAFNNELEDSRRVTEELQQALKDIQDKTSFTDADAKTRAKNTEELHQVLRDVQKRMSLFDAELKDARKLSERMQQELAEAQSKELSLAQVPPPAKENEAVADLKAVVENLQQEFRGASLRAEVGELQRQMSQLQQAMVEVQRRSGQGQDALRGGLDELVQVVEAVRHALCESESEVNELRKASEHCQEVLGATASHGQLEELQKRLVDMEKGQLDIQQHLRLVAVKQSNGCSKACCQMQMFSILQLILRHHDVRSPSIPSKSTSMRGTALAAARCHWFAYRDMAQVVLSSQAAGSTCWNAYLNLTARWNGDN